MATDQPDSVTDRIGCESCTGENPTWTKPYVTDNGYTVFVCDDCGRAQIQTQSMTQETELWEYNVYRDDKGRFAEKPNNE